MTIEPPLVVYWAPYAPNERIDWNMLYSEPENVYRELIKNKEPKSTNVSMFSCPAVSDRMKRSFVFKNNLKTKFDYDFTDLENPIVSQLDNDGVTVEFFKHSSLVGGAAVAMQLSYVFFSEESVVGLINTPMYHRPKFLLNGMVVPGGYDLSKWIRPLSLEIQLWNNKGSVVIDENEPLFYLELITDRPVVLKRFSVNFALEKLIAGCFTAPSTMGRNLPLKSRYSRFISTKTHKKVLNEIKNSLID